MKRISIPICNLSLQPYYNSPIETQLIFGEEVEIIDKKGSWLNCRVIQDNYKGWIKKNSVSELEAPNFQVISLVCHIYEKPDIKSRTLNTLFYNSKIQIMHKDNLWFVCNYKGKKGYIFNKHLIEIKSIKENGNDWVKKVEQFVNTTYLWGGKSYLGVDCSGLLQLVLQSYQILLPRNSNDQFKSKKLISFNKNKIERGVIIFWKGHVAIATNNNDIIHANAYHMKVNIEKYINVRDRIKKSYGKLLGFKKIKL